MAEIKLVLTDMDGTIVQFGKMHEVSQRVRDTVIACEKGGVRVVVVTGRYFAIAQPVLLLLGIDDLCIFDNGASIINARTGKLVWSKWLEADAVRVIARILIPAARLIDYSENHDQHKPADNEIELIARINRPASHVYARIALDKVDVISRQLREVPNITFYFAPSPDGETDVLGVQVNHSQADKFHGVTALRDITNISKAHTLAIGDGVNDLPLFRNAGLKIAMGNASDDLKGAADHIVGSVDEDGFAEAMERFVLNRRFHN